MFPLVNQVVLHPSTSTFSCYHHCHRCIHSMEPGRHIRRRSYEAAYENAMWRRFFWEKMGPRGFAFKNYVKSHGVKSLKRIEINISFEDIFLMHLFKLDGYSCQHFRQHLKSQHIDHVRKLLKYSWANFWPPQMVVY